MRGRAELWEQVVEHLDAGIVLVDPALTVIYWNPWMARTTGFPAEEVEGRFLGETFPHLFDGGTLDRLRSVVEQGVPATFSHAFHRALFPPHGPQTDDDVPLYQEVKSLPLRTGDEIEGAALLVYDVTALALREFALTEAARQLRVLREEMACMREEMTLQAPSIDKILALLEGAP
ncbi:MAG: PAS domain-containing protein [Deltaproteobacteria bacterium]|nr:PAS domain-containing protein [Deltaproteobacteria bacterium]